MFDTIDNRCLAIFYHITYQPWGVKLKVRPKKICKRLSVRNEIGVCNLRDCVCNCWLCEYKEKCGKEVFSKCQLKSNRFHKISDVSLMYREALKKIETEIQLLMEKGDRKKIIGGLLWRRESEILHCFCEAPGDLPSAISTANSIIDEDISMIKFEDVKFNPIAAEAWNLIVLKEVYSTKISRIDNGDIFYFANNEGKKELKKLIDKPKYWLDTMREASKKNVFPTIESQNMREVYSTKMLHSMEWCLNNINQTNLMDFTLYENYKKIIKHIYEVGDSGTIDTSICYKLAYPHYSGMLHVCRYSYSKFNHIKEISQKNKGLHLLLKKKFGINFDAKIAYDNFLIELHRCDEVGKYCIDEIIGEDSKEYRFIIRDGSLFGSILLLGFISKNYDQICLKPYERGRVFEDFVEKELTDRKVSVLHRNYEILGGDIDFVCRKDKRLFFIEAKDYGPWFDDNYISSRTYNERICKINNKIDYALPRYQWVDSNREILGLPPYDKLEGLILTRFREPHIEIPTNFDCISIEDLSMKFGKSKSEKFFQRKFKFNKDQLSEMDKQILDQKLDQNNRFNLR